jgi:signal transduction histidine kinase
MDANNQLGRLLVSLVIGNLLTLAIALVGGFWLADQAMRPVHTITQTAQQISETDLNKRLHLGGDDELSELANTFDEMLDRLQSAFERQRQFTADASHELRTPLTIIDLESSRALTNRRSVEEYERILHTIQSENQFMIRLVNNLLALARMDAGQVNLKIEPLDLGDLTLELVERMRPLADNQGVTLSIGDVPEIIIQGDRPTLIQMLTNLVENAIKYSASVIQPQVNITAGRRVEDGQSKAWVRISDNGVGIAPEHLRGIFDRFYQVDAARSRSEKMESDVSGQDSSGTGLGLAIAQWIAYAHYGEIRVESTKEQGSTFEVVMPAYNHDR